MGSMCSSSDKGGGEGGRKGKKERRGSFSKNPISSSYMDGDPKTPQKKKKGKKKKGAKNGGTLSDSLNASALESSSRAVGKKKRSVSPSSVDSKKVTSLIADEPKKRAVLQSSEQRQFQMHLNDFAQNIPRAPVPQIVVGGEDDDDPFSDEDEGSRRCSMNVSEHTAASKVGALHKQRMGTSPLYSPNTPSSPYARASVKKHSTEEDLWVIVRGKIYDLTNFVDDHPGGSWMIIKNAGQDATQEFEEAHDRSMWGSLAKFYVADVVE